MPAFQLAREFASRSVESCAFCCWIYLNCTRLFPDRLFCCGQQRSEEAGRNSLFFDCLPSLFADDYSEQQVKFIFDCSVEMVEFSIQSTLAESSSNGTNYLAGGLEPFDEALQSSIFFFDEPSQCGKLLSSPTNNALAVFNSCVSGSFCLYEAESFFCVNSFTASRLGLFIARLLSLSPDHQHTWLILLTNAAFALARTITFLALCLDADSTLCWSASPRVHSYLFLISSCARALFFYRFFLAFLLSLKIAIAGFWFEYERISTVNSIQLHRHHRIPFGGLSQALF